MIQTPPPSLSRSEYQHVLESYREKPAALCVVGGGIHGAVAARRAAEAGYSVVLLERTDYAAETSSRSSKMAHGGLRYLEMLDFQQVFEGIKARESLFERFPHLVRPERFLIPVKSGAHFFKWKLRAGLILYDLFVKNAERRHQFIPLARLNFDGFHSGRTDLMGCFSYTDGLMDDSRLVQENISRARAAGAICLNYAEVLHVKARGAAKSGVEISWRDGLSQKSATFIADKILNCAGPWVQRIVPEAPKAPKVLFSRGVHLLFDRPWTSPSLFLPMPGKARYYFVWPHQGGTMVGTTEGPTDEAEFDPMPLQGEVDEILQRLERDLPESNLNRATLYSAFAGVRTLPQRRSTAQSTTESRKHIWFGDEQILSLVGGKYTTAEWTAAEGLRKLGFTTSEASYAASVRALDSSRLERLAEKLDLTLESTRAFLLRHLPFAEAVFEEQFSSGMVANCPAPRAEFEVAMKFEQTETLDDMLRRRLGLELLPGNGLGAIEHAVSVLKQHYPERDIDAQARRYRERIALLYERMGKGLTGTQNSEGPVAQQVGLSPLV